MKTIEEAAKNYADSLKLCEANYVNKEDFEKYSITDFEAGATFAQRWISVEEEFPEKDEKGKLKYSILIKDSHLKKIEVRNIYFSVEEATHWRPIERK